MPAAALRFEKRREIIVRYFGGRGGRMRAGSKALVWLLVLTGILIFGVVAVVVVAVEVVARHLPGRAVLHLEIGGAIPEVAPELGLPGVLGPAPVTRRELRDGLVAAVRDARIRAVRVRIHDLQTGLATVQELRALLQRVGEAGKPTTAFLETAGEFAPGNLEYYLATACNRILVNPLGDVNLVGFAARVPFLRGSLDKLGIEPEFPGIGDYKTARFFYTHRDFTVAHREMLEWLLASFAEQMVNDIAQGRGVPSHQAGGWVQGGPYLGPQALAEGLIDDLVDWDGFCRQTTTLEGQTLEEVSLRRFLRSGRPDRRGAKIAVVLGQGAIMRGESGFSPMPLFGGEVMGAETLAQAWRQVRRSGAKAAIFRIDSPGGSAVASEIIRAEMARTAAEIPVVVSMGDVAASGGYWVSCGARRVIASPGTITGSIGVFAGHLAASDFFEDKLGVTWGRIDGSPNAAIYGGLDPWTPAQREVVQRSLDRIYQAFLERVSETRGMSREEVDAVGQGRVFTGAQALAHGLVDGLGGFEEALAAVREEAGLAVDAPVELDFFPRPEPIWKRLLQRGEEEVALRRLARALAEGRLEAPRPPGAVWLPLLEIR